MQKDDSMSNRPKTTPPNDRPRKRTYRKCRVHCLVFINKQ